MQNPARKAVWQSRTFWSALSAAVLVLPPAIDSFASIMPDNWRVRFLAAAVFCNAAGNLFARIAGIVASIFAAEQGIAAAETAVDAAATEARRVVREGGA